MDEKAGLKLFFCWLVRSALLPSLLLEFASKELEDNIGTVIPSQTLTVYQNNTQRYASCYNIWHFYSQLQHDVKNCNTEREKH